MYNIVLLTAVYLINFNLSLNSKLKFENYICWNVCLHSSLEQTNIDVYPISINNC